MKSFSVTIGLIGCYCKNSLSFIDILNKLKLNEMTMVSPDQPTVFN